MLLHLKLQNVRTSWHLVKSVTQKETKLGHVLYDLLILLHQQTKGVFSHIDFELFTIACLTDDILTPIIIKLDTWWLLQFATKLLHFHISSEDKVSARWRQ